MALQFYREGSIVGIQLVREHCDRAAEQWYWAGECYFWLLGPGASSGKYLFQNRLRYVVEDEQRRCELERRKRGWTLETLRAAYEYARSQPDGKVRFPKTTVAEAKKNFTPSTTAPARRRGLDDDDIGSRMSQSFGSWLPVPTIERDWQESNTMSDEQRAALRVLAFSGKMPRRERETLAAVAEVIYDGDAQGNW